MNSVPGVMQLESNRGTEGRTSPLWKEGWEEWKARNGKGVWGRNGKGEGRGEEWKGGAGEEWKGGMERGCGGGMERGRVNGRGGGGKLC